MAPVRYWSRRPWASEPITKRRPSLIEAGEITIRGISASRSARPGRSSARPACRVCSGSNVVRTPIHDPRCSVRSPSLHLPVAHEHVVGHEAERQRVQHIAGDLFQQRLVVAVHAVALRLFGQDRAVGNMRPRSSPPEEPVINAVRSISFPSNRLSAYCRQSMVQSMERNPPPLVFTNTKGGFSSAVDQYLFFCFQSSKVPVIAWHRVR